MYKLIALCFPLLIISSHRHLQVQVSCIIASGETGYRIQTLRPALSSLSSWPSSRNCSNCPPSQFLECKVVALFVGKYHFVRYFRSTFPVSGWFSSFYSRWISKLVDAIVNVPTSSRKQEREWINFLSCCWSMCVRSKGTDKILEAKLRALQYFAKKKYSCFLSFE